MCTGAKLEDVEFPGYSLACTGFGVLVNNVYPAAGAIDRRNFHSCSSCLNGQEQSSCHCPQLCTRLQLYSAVGTAWLTHITMALIAPDTESKLVTKHGQWEQLSYYRSASRKRKTACSSTVLLHSGPPNEVGSKILINYSCFSYVIEVGGRKGILRY